MIDPQEILRRPEHRIATPRPGGRVLVTGGAGYIGSALVKHFAPNALAVDTSESALAALADEGVNVELADIRDTATLDDVFARYRPDVVIHAAAYKHVSLLERFPFEAFLTNAIGTKRVADAAEAHGAGKFVLLSTDKAADPVSILGLSKRVAELIVLSRTQSKTRFGAVRFGNVFGSTGSVVPIFADQIARGGPVTVTDPAASRFFITAAEAVGALCAIAANEHLPGLFAYAPAPLLKISELAARMIRAAGRNGNVEITFSGLRAGEKLCETLYGERERMTRSQVEGLFRVIADVPGRQSVEDAAAEILNACRERQVGRLLAAANRITGALTPRLHDPLPQSQASGR